MLLPSVLFTFAASLVSAAAVLGPRSEAEPNGSPGLMCYADVYNTLGSNWNKTYASVEPQQIHLSLTDDAQFVRVQFATLEQVDHSILKYWPSKGRSKRVTTVEGKDWSFVDGGLAKRELYLHQLKTKELCSDTIYSYQVGSVTNNKQIQWSQKYEFHTAPKKKDFSFIAIGDVGVCNAVSVSHVVDLAKTQKYDFVTIGGDQAYDLHDFNGTKGDQYLNFMQDVFARVPYLGSVGNHESEYNFSHYKNRFDNVPYRESKFDNSVMYSINYKSLHLISFSTEIYFSDSTEEIKTAVNWLDADLTKANEHRKERPWIIFLTHHPIYCSVDDDDCTTKADTIKYGPVDPITNQTWGGLEELLLKHKVDIYMSGHVHNYERTYPVAKGKRMATSYHNAPSFFQLVIGNAGQPEHPSPFGAGPFADWSAVRYASYGFSTFKVSPTALNIVHHQANVDGSLGGIVDQFTVSKDSDRHK